MSTRDGQNALAAARPETTYWPCLPGREAIA